MIGAGGQAGQNDAANLLKPALARGELRTIAATTWSEYKKYFEKDAALARRFQVVKVEEPSEHQCLIMMRGLVASLEKHHNVRILDEAVCCQRAALAPLSGRTPVARQGRERPRHRLRAPVAGTERHPAGSSKTPPARSTTSKCRSGSSIARRSSAPITRRSWPRSRSKRPRPTTQAARPSGALGQGARAGQEDSRSCASKLEAGHAANGDRRTRSRDAASAATQIRSCRPLKTELAALQGETGLIRVCVDAQIVGEVLSAWTGIPVGKMLKDEITTVLALQEHLGKRVIGQPHAMEIISQRIQTSRASLDDPNKPVGVFMLVGPSGVGKTETALALSDLLYGGEHNLITINMSEFQEAAHRLHAEGLASGIRRLRRRRRAHRGGAPPPLFRRPAGRGRKGPSRRARTLLPGLRQGQDGGWRRPSRSTSRTPSSSSPPTPAPTS